MLARLSLVFSMFMLLLFMYGILINVQKIEDNKCRMTYMYEVPQFLRLPLLESDSFPAFGLYAYTEGENIHKVKSVEFSGAPILFIPGNGGSFKQVRSLASVALRKAIKNNLHTQANFFTVDLDEQYSGLYGGVLDQQVEFVQLCIRKILELYSRYSDGPKSLILVGHSMGGKIAQAVAVYPGIAPLINTILAISSPLDLPVLAMDHYYHQFYTTINEHWSSNRSFCTTTLKISTRFDQFQCDETDKPIKSLDHILLVTIGGGVRDTMVHDALTYSTFSDLHAMTYNIPNVWLSADHVCIVWCLQLVLVINRFFYSIIQTNKFGKNKFIDAKYVRKQQANLYFKGKDAYLTEKLKIRNNVDHETWIEDIRRNFQYKFKTGLPRTRMQMIRLTDDPLYKYLACEVTNLLSKDWVFGCAANEMHENMRYCSDSISLNNYSKILPPREHNRQIVELDLHDLKHKNPSWTHVLLRFPKSQELLYFSIDINMYYNRILNVTLPKWYSFGNTALIDDTQLGSIFYKINIYGLDYSFQAFAIVITTRSCNSTSHPPLIDVNIPWSEHFNRFSYNVRAKNRSIFYVFIPVNTPVHRTGDYPVLVNLYISPECRYSISYEQSISVMIARIVQQFGSWVPAHCVAVLLLSFKHQMSLIPDNKNFKCGSFNLAIVKSTPLFLISASRAFDKIFSLLKILPQPENCDASFIILIIINGAAKAFLYMVTAVAWTCIVSCGNLVHRILLRLIACPLPQVSSTLVFFIQKFPLAIGIILISVAFTSSGSVALSCACFIYFIKITKMYEEYLENCVHKIAQNAANYFGREVQNICSRKDIGNKDQSNRLDDENATTSSANNQKEYDSIHHCLNCIHFHFTMFLLLVVACMINFPNFITWAKTYRFSPSLKPDASLIPSLIQLICLSTLWQITSPKNIKGYKHIAGILYLLAVVCIVYCQVLIYRLNFVISSVFLIVTVHQVFGQKRNVEN
ncbi:GPI inositol-deacylase isoform X2 [Sabethes cyaneus]|uniref:GPI inositol-deacylase isoform X2 n=1 Tax=Sabethes cyaneus TaxID=53552 RepID=UPI00221E2E14|nr:GPI inositol-deacylase isoform X2 [Sabethes cyaneus]